MPIKDCISKKVKEDCITVFCGMIGLMRVEKKFLYVLIKYGIVQLGIGTVR